MIFRGIIYLSYTRMILSPYVSRRKYINRGFFSIPGLWRIYLFYWLFCYIYLFCIKLNIIFCERFSLWKAGTPLTWEYSVGKMYFNVCTLFIAVSSIEFKLYIEFFFRLYFTVASSFSFNLEIFFLKKCCNNYFYAIFAILPSICVWSYPMNSNIFLCLF